MPATKSEEELCQPPNLGKMPASPFLVAGTFSPKADASDLWDCRWDVGDQARPDQRIWRVAYGRVAADQPPFPALQIDATELKDRFAAILVTIGEFARRHRLDMFAKPFPR